MFLVQEQELRALQASHEELQGQFGGQGERWRGQVDDLKAQLRGEATRVLELQKKAYNAKMAQEAAVQVQFSSSSSSAPQEGGGGGGGRESGSFFLCTWRSRKPGCS